MATPLTCFIGFYLLNLEDCNESSCAWVSWDLVNPEGEEEKERERAGERERDRLTHRWREGGRERMVGPQTRLLDYSTEVDASALVSHLVNTLLPRECNRPVSTELGVGKKIDFLISLDSL